MTASSHSAVNRFPRIIFPSFSTEDENGHKPEALNKKAVAIVNRVRDKLTGTSFTHVIVCRSLIGKGHSTMIYFCDPNTFCSKGGVLLNWLQKRPSCL